MTAQESTIRTDGLELLLGRDDARAQVTLTDTGSGKRWDRCPSSPWKYSTSR